MPPRKRTLTESDPNIDPPNAKKKGKEKNSDGRKAIGTGNIGNRQLITKVSGKKAGKGSVKKNAKASSKKSPKEKDRNKDSTSPSKASSKPKTKIIEDDVNFVFEASCPPLWEAQVEKKNEEMERKSGTKCPEMIDFYVKEEYKNIGSACKERCVCHMPIDDFPGWPWMFTSKGFNHGQKWLKQMEDRNQDAQGIDIDVYFTGYGIQEVVENILAEFNRIMAKKAGVSLTDMWAIMEGITIALCGEDMLSWFMMDMCNVHGDTLKLMGTAILTTLDILEEHDAFPKIKNLGVVMSCLLLFAREGQESGCRYHEAGWMRHVLATARSHKVELKGPLLSETAEAYAEMDLESNKESLEKAANTTAKRDEVSAEGRKWIAWDRKSEFKEYKEKYQSVRYSDTRGPTHKHTKFGGATYDLTKKYNREHHKQKHSNSRAS